MAIVNVNTEILIKCGENLLKLSNEYDVVVKEFFDKISKIDSNGIWVGENLQNSSAKTFLERSLKEQTNYLEFEESLIQCGNEMISYAEKIESVMKDNQIG